MCLNHYACRYASTIYKRIWKCELCQYFLINASTFSHLRAFFKQNVGWEKIECKYRLGDGETPSRFLKEQTRRLLTFFRLAWKRDWVAIPRRATYEVQRKCSRCSLPFLKARSKILCSLFCSFGSLPEVAKVRQRSRQRQATNELISANHSIIFVNMNPRMT